jgi:hypothetical protein
VTTAPLLRHGEYIKPQYASGWAGKSVDEERLGGRTSGIVRRFERDGQASFVSTTLGLLSSASDEAIRYSTARSSALRGLAQVNSVVFTGMAYALYWWRTHSEHAPALRWLDTLLGTAFLAFLVWLLTFSARLELFRPIDEPIIFDRKRRKVYRIFCEAQPGLKGLVKPWPMRACEYDWDLIDAEHNARVVTSGSTLRRDSSLVFIVRRSADDPTIIDSFNIGSPLLMSLDETVAATYEHIRRFMEDNGPPVPEGESLPEPAARRGVLGTLWHHSPFQPWYWRAWRQELPLMLLAHVLFPVTIVFGGLWLFFNRLAVWTSRPIEWPPEVAAAVGPVVAARQSASGPT